MEPTSSMFPEETPLRRKLLRGVRDGVPIGLGYFAVAFSLGITARGVGLSAFQGFLASFLNHASAGEYALFSLIGAQAAYWEVATVIFITNARYLLMSCALSQRFSPETPFIHRLGVGFTITDEIFGLGIAQRGALSPPYLYGAFTFAVLCWASGTACGIVAGNILPARVVSALSVAIYGMFLAIIVPPGRENRIVGALILLSFGASYVFSVLPALASLSSGLKTILLTVAISALAAMLFPVPDTEGGDGT